MNKLIGLSLGAAALLTAASTTSSNPNEKKRNISNNLNEELVTVTAYFNNSTHYDQNIKSSNGFFYKKGEKTYLVTTAHTIIDNWQSIGDNTIVADKVSILYQGKSYDIDTEYWLYSKYYDIMLISVEKIIGFTWSINRLEQVNAFSKSEDKNPSKVSVLYIDPISNKPIKKEAEYVSQVAASMHLGAIAHHLLDGSSGSPVFSIHTNDEKLVGMVTSTDQEYQSMSLTIPAETIDSFIDIYIKKLNGPKYLGVETNLINTSYASAIKNETLGKLYDNKQQQFMGELVINTSKENKLNPFDIVTSVDGTAVGNGLDRSINIALANTTSSNSVSVNGFKIDPDFRKKFCAYPRQITKEYQQTADSFSKLNMEGKKDSRCMIEFKNGVKKFYLIKQVKPNIILKPELKDQSNIKNITVYESSYVYYNIIKGIINKEDLSEESVSVVKSFITSFTQKTAIKFNGDEKTLTSDSYRELIILAIFKNWCFLVLNFIKNLDYGNQFYVLSKETKKLMEKLKPILKKIFLDTESYLSTLMITEFFIKASEFAGPNTINLLKSFYISLNYSKFVFFLKDQKIELDEKTNEEYKELILKSFKEELKSNLIIKYLNKKNTSAFESKFNIEEDEIFDQIVKGDNNFTISQFQEEHYQFKNNLSDRTTYQKQENNKLVAKDLELVYQEIDNAINADLSKNKLYYIRNYTNIKSYWDHANITLAQVLQDPSLKYSPMSTDNSEQELQDIPKYLDTWQYNSVLQMDGGNSWITHYLHQENLLTNQDLETFSNLTFYGLKNHKDFTQGYRSSFQSTMDKFKQKASKDDWLNLQSWSKQILEQIKANQLEEAFQGFKNKVLQLTNQYNPNLQFDSIEALDMYFMAKQIAKH